MGCVNSIHTSEDVLFVWQDREIRFDCTPEELELRSGEFEIDRADDIEDSRANQGVSGILIVTNLRVIWTATRKNSLNVSIGMNSIADLNIHTTGGTSNGLTQSLILLTRSEEDQLEFAFMNMEKNNSPRIFISIQGVLSRYDTSRLYRDIFTNGSARVKDSQLLPLAREEATIRETNVWLIEEDQTSGPKSPILGTIILTNIRLVWFEKDASSSNNISIPWIHIRNVRRAKGSQSVFQLDITPLILPNKTFTFQTEESLDKPIGLAEEIMNACGIHLQNPIFGVEYKVVNRAPSIAQFKVVLKNHSVANLMVKKHMV